MKRVFTLLAVVTLCCSVVTAQRGQGRPGQGRPGGQQGRPGGQGFQRGGGGGSRAGSGALERAGLEVGKALPDLKIFDENGAEYRLVDMKGKHTVIVFGCMT